MCKICTKVISQLAHIKNHDDDTDFHVGELRNKNLQKLRPFIHKFIHDQEFFKDHIDDCYDLGDCENYLDWYGDDEVIYKAVSYIPSVLDDYYDLDLDVEGLVK